MEADELVTTKDLVSTQAQDDLTKPGQALKGHEDRGLCVYGKGLFQKHRLGSISGVVRFSGQGER